MLKVISSLLVSSFFFLAPITAFADEAGVKAQVEEIAEGLLERLPLDQRIVIKALSPEESGLPEDFLRKLSSDLEAALLLASEFEINLANRLTTEDLWAEAVEFGDADFDELYAASQADIVLMITPRATGAGVEISVTAYRLLGDDAGQVIASSGTVVLAMDMENSLGVDINSLNDQMAQVLQEIEAVGQTGGLISNANTYAEFYHNARIFQQRGEVDLAMNNYEQALSQDVVFVDPLLDLLTLATARYGESGAQRYFEMRVEPNLPEELIALSQINRGQVTLSEIYSESDIFDRDVFPPLLAVWLEKQSLEEIASNVDISTRKYTDDYVFLESARIVLESYQSGEFQRYFIDKVFAATFIDVTQLEIAISKINRFEYSSFIIAYQPGAPEQYLEIENCTVARWGETSMGREVTTSMITDPNFLVQRVEGRIAARPWCEGVEYEVEGGQWWQQDGTQSVRNFSNSGGFEVNDIEHIGETGECPFQPNLDRVVFGDICGESEYYAIGRLLITDNVDITEPIIVRMGVHGAEEKLLFYDTDISVDGTFFSKLPAPLGATAGEGEHYFEPHRNRWLYAPGLVQSSLQSFQMYDEFRPTPMISEIRYTDQSGNLQVVKNGMVGLPYMWQDRDYNDQESFGFDGGKSYPIVRAQYTLSGLLEMTTSNYLEDRLASSTFFDSYERYQSFLTEQKNSAVSTAIIQRIRDVFIRETSADREFLQQSLRQFGFYTSRVDGQWGSGTEDAFQGLFYLLAQHYPNQEYLEDYNLSGGRFTRNDVVDFWNAVAGCDQGQLLSITDTCN
jgi:hypothetical protein